MALVVLLWGTACHRFDDADDWAKRFDDPERDEWQRPDEAIAALSLARDARIADIGAGTGYFATRLARVVPEGRVWGVDIAPGMVRYLRDRARREGLANLFSILGAADDPLLPEPVDLVLIVNTYHHIEEREVYFGRLAHQLRPGGRVAIIDYKRESVPVGPPSFMKLTGDQVRAEMAAAGYKLTQQHTFLPYQYFLVFAHAPQPGQP